MPRRVRVSLVLLLLAAPVWAAAPTTEMVTVSTTAVGPTANLCVSTPAGGQAVESGAYVQILDQSVYYRTGCEF